MGYREDSVKERLAHLPSSHFEAGVPIRTQSTAHLTVLRIGGWLRGRGLCATSGGRGF